MLIANYATLWDRAINHVNPEYAMRDWSDDAEPQGFLCTDIETAKGHCIDEVSDLMTDGHVLWSGPRRSDFDPDRFVWRDVPGGIHFELLYVDVKVAHLTVREAIQL